jgi:DNA-binding MltR family transcriptional regulator
LRAPTTSRFETFFGGLGPLATFAARTHLTYLLGFIDTKTYEDLCRIRDVRNRFAHASEQIDFNDEEIKNWCTNLHHYMKRRLEPARSRFINAAVALELTLDSLIVTSANPTTPPDGPEDAYEELRRQYEMYQKLATEPPDEQEKQSL